MYSLIEIGTTILPSPTKITPSEEILWSSKTGRSVKTGTMIGAVVAEKKTLDIEWTDVTEEDYQLIKKTLKAGFFGPVKYRSSSGTVILSMDKAYRGTLQPVAKGYVAGVHYYDSVKVSIIEK